MSLTKIAVLSNANMNFVIRMLKKEYEVYDSEGYGNELGVMMNPESSYHTFDPKLTFVIMDLMEVLEHELEPESPTAASKVKQWFSALEACLKPEQIYYISDAYLWGTELAVLSDPDQKRALEAIWQECLVKLCNDHANVYIFPYHHMVETLGEENAFSLKMWYMGKILHTNEAQKRLGCLIGEKVVLQSRTAKKVLLLDLDNTLWNGILIEADAQKLELRPQILETIKWLDERGIIQCVASKNDYEQVYPLLEELGLAEYFLS